MAEVTMLVDSVFPGPQGGAVFAGKDQSGSRVRAVADRDHICRPPHRGDRVPAGSLHAALPLVGDRRAHGIRELDRGTQGGASAG